jgi:hypothetical protein
MAARTDTPRPNGSGSIAPTADFDARLATELGQRIEGRGSPHRNVVAALTPRLDQSTQHVPESRQGGEQLKASLEKSTRRIQQLIGERDRLTSLLAGRDAELKRLNREIGALTERAAPAARRAPALFATASALLEKIRPARTAPARAKSTGSQPETTKTAPAERALVPWLKDGPPKAVLGMVVFGLSEAEIASVLDVVERYCAERDLAPLLLTDSDAFQLFRGRRVLFEFLPPRSDRERFAPELDWRLFTLRRLALIRRKWQPVRVVAFGRTAAEVVQLWHGSPFEATPIPAALKGRAEAAELDWGAARRPQALQP